MVLDGRERDCLKTEPGHEVHKYRRYQGRDSFLYVQFVDLANGVEADTVPASEATACVSGVGAATNSRPARTDNGPGVPDIMPGL